MMQHTAPPPVLEVGGLNIAYGGTSPDQRVVHDVSFSLPAGKTLGIVGESGSGKSTTLHAVTRLLPHTAHVTSDFIRLNGREIGTAAESEIAQIRGKEIGVVFQNPMSALNPSMRILSQIREPLDEHLRLSSVQSRDRVRELLSLVGLPDDERLLAAYPHELSGGMKQRVMIAIALSCRPRLILADEPTTALDVTIQAQIIELLKELTQTLGMSLIIVTHDLGVVASIADTVAVMKDGRVIEQGTVEQIYYEPAHAYTRQLLTESALGDLTDRNG